MSSNAVSMLRFARVTTEEPRRRRQKPAVRKAPAEPVAAAPVAEPAVVEVPVRKRWPSLVRPPAAVLHG